MENVSFANLGVEEVLIRVLRSQGILEPFEVQRATIPDALHGHDIYCRAPTGSGKTLAFGIPLLSRCTIADPFYPTSLILTPTRELAEQITQVLTPLAHSIELEVVAIYGGTSYGRQKKYLERGADVVVACPGRLLDLIESGVLSLEDVDIVVIDEADRMADMGFIDPVCEIINQCSAKRQTILYSATLDEDVSELVRKFQQDPVRIEIGPKEISMEDMKHFFWLVRNSVKSEASNDIIRKLGRSIIFCRTRAGVDRVGDDLERFGLNIATLHGGLTQRQRSRAMNRFIQSESIALIATDVAARGIDIEGVECVIHYDPPENHKTYKHRSGRTARAGTQGTVISLVQNPQKRTYLKIQKQVGIRCSFTPPDLTELPNTGYTHDSRQRPRRKSKQKRRNSNRNDSNYKRTKTKSQNSPRSKHRAPRYQSKPNKFTQKSGFQKRSKNKFQKQEKKFRRKI